MMKLNTAHRLALLACLPAAAGAATASAGTVTLLSQERSVSVEQTGLNLFGDGGQPGPRGVIASDEVSAGDFDRFDTAVALDLDAEDFVEGGIFGGITNSSRFSTPAARQTSSFSQEGDAVIFTSSGGASSGAPDSSATFAFEVEFQLSATTPYRLMGMSSVSYDAPRFIFEDRSGQQVRDLLAFEVTQPQEFFSRYVFDGSGTDPRSGDLLPSDGELEAGRYRFGATGTATNPGYDAGGFSLDDFGIVLLDSTLAGSGDDDGGPVPIPSPAALPAGLALLGAGLMRRRRNAGV